MMLNIKASDVAAIIGKNPYKTADQVFNERISVYFNAPVKTEQKVFEEALANEDPIVQKEVTRILERSKSAPINTHEELAKIPESVKEYVRHEMYKNNGTHNESKTAEKFNVEKDPTFYTLPLYRNVRLVGMIDGRKYKDGQIVEIKNRQNRLFGVVPEYENIQVQVYMKLTGVHRCKFIEQYKDHTKEYDIGFNSFNWPEIEEQLVEFAKRLYEYQNSEDPLDSTFE
jgi:hypothetical protein